MDQPLRTFEDLVALLVARKIPHQVDAANHAIQVATQPPALPSVVFLRWEAKLPYIQIIQQMTPPVPDERQREIEIACTRVNDVAALPGYGFNYATKVVYYRIATPVYDGAITPTALDRAITAVLNNAAQLAAAFKAVSDGADGATVLSHVAK